MSFQPWREIQQLHAASIVHGLSDLGFSALLLVYRVWGFGAENHGQKPLGIGKLRMHHIGRLGFPRLPASEYILCLQLQGSL